MSQHPASKPLRWSLLAAPVAGVMLLAGCSGGGDAGSTDDASADGFSLMVAQANDADFYAQMAAAYTEETGTEIEVIPYPSDAYNTQVTTQFQAGNAADVAILSPGTGQPISVITLADEQVPLTVEPEVEPVAEVQIRHRRDQFGQRLVRGIVADHDR